MSQRLILPLVQFQKYSMSLIGDANGIAARFVSAVNAR